jgi:hypothetical protein
MASTLLNSGQKAIIGAAIATICFCPPQYSPEFAQLEANAIEPIASLAPMADHTRAPLVATAQEMISNLRKGGMPVSAIADAVRVERKSVYAWLGGGLVRPANALRIAQVHSLLTGIPGVDSRGLYRFWNTALAGGNTLCELITTENIDEPKVKLLLECIRPAAQRLSLNEKKMRRTGTANAFLDEISEAGTDG